MITSSSRVAGAILFLRGLERLFQPHHVLARTQVVERLALALEVFLAVVRRLDRQTDAALGLVHLDHARLDLLADLEDVLDLRHVVLAQLRDVHQPVDVVLELHERAEARQLRDLARDQIADLVLRVDVLPRVAVELLHAQADALVLLVDVDDHGLDLVALLEHLARLIDLARPRHVGDVDHAVDAFLDLHERAVGGHVADLALDHGARRVLLLDLVPRVGLPTGAGPGKSSAPPC